MSATPPKPNGPTWRRCGPRPTAARAWPGWPVRWRRCGRASSRSTTAWPSCRSASRKPPPAPSRAQVEFETVQGRVGELDQGEVGLDEHHDRTVAALRLADERVAELQSAERGAERQVASLRARIEALSITLERKDGAAWLTRNRGGAGLFGSIAKLVKVRFGLRGRACRGARRGRRRAGSRQLQRGGLGGDGAEAGRRRPRGHRAERLAGHRRPSAGDVPPARRRALGARPGRGAGAAARRDDRHALRRRGGRQPHRGDGPGGRPPAVACGHPRRRSGRCRLGQRRFRPQTVHAGDHLRNRQGA